MTVRVSVDRELPIPVGVQIKGQIEYGIGSGMLKPGTRLPSVRELAAAEGVAHVTVSHAYSALKREGLIEVRPGMGTFVADPDLRARRRNGGDLSRLVDAMVTEALERGYRPADISHMVMARLMSRQARRPVVAIVGVFDRATELYARDITAVLADLQPDVHAHTIAALLTNDDEEIERVCDADVVLTLANRVKEVQDLLGPCAPPVRGLAFVAHPDTIERLRALPREGQLGVISTFAEFLPTLLHGVTAHASPRKPILSAVLSDAERVCAVLARATAIVYASGSEDILARVPRGMPAIEYLHTPEPSSVQAVRPVLARMDKGWPHPDSDGRWNDTEDS